MDTLPPHDQNGNVNRNNPPSYPKYPAWPNTSGIYIITCVASNNSYVGSAVNLLRRRYQHLYNLRHNKHINNHLQRAYNLYGEAFFTFEILEHVEDRSNLIVREQHYVDILDPKYNLSRIVGQSNLGRTFPEEVRKKMGDARRGKPGTPMSEENRAKLIARNLGHVPSEETRRLWSEQRKGRGHTEESRAKMSQSRKGRIVSEETRAKISAIHKGKTISERQRQQVREAALNRPPDSEETRHKKGNAWRGRKHTEETKQKMRGPRLNRIRDRMSKEANQIGKDIQQQSMTEFIATDDIKQLQFNFDIGDEKDA